MTRHCPVRIEAGTGSGVARDEGRNVSATSARQLADRGPTVRLVTSDDDHRAVRRLRYDVYVEEMGRPECDADHEARELSDRYDESARILGAFEGNTAIGTVRWNRGADLSEADARFWRLHSTACWHPLATCAVTKLAVPSTHRVSSLPVRLCVRCYADAYRAGIRFGAVDCNEPRRRFFERMGFEALGPQAHHPKYGRVHVMVLRMADWAYLRGIRSPFATTFEELAVDPDASRVTLDELVSRFDATHTKDPS